MAKELLLSKSKSQKVNLYRTDAAWILVSSLSYLGANFLSAYMDVIFSVLDNLFDNSKDSYYERDLESHRKALNGTLRVLPFSE